MHSLVKRLLDSADRLEKEVVALGDNASVKPMDIGRSAIDQVAECALITAYVADCTLARQMGLMDKSAYEAAKADLDTTEKAVAALNAATVAFVAAYEALPEDVHAEEAILPWGTKSTLGDLGEIVCWNNIYHIGQISYIQTLFGM